MVHLFEFFVVPILTTGGDRTGLYLYSDSIRRLSCGGKAGTCRRSKRLLGNIVEAIENMMRQDIDLKKKFYDLEVSDVY